MPDISEFSDEPGKVWKLTGPDSVSSPGGEPAPDYEALAAQAETAHREANERYAQAQVDSYDAAFRQLVFTAAAAGALTVVLEPSDQGEHMTINEVTFPEDLDVDENEVENDLYDGAADLPDYETATWTILPGVTVEQNRREGIHTATIDITVAAPAAVEALYRITEEN